MKTTKPTPDSIPPETQRLAIDTVRNAKGYLANNMVTSLDDACLRSVFLDLYWAWSVLERAEIYFLALSPEDIQWLFYHLDLLQDELADRDPDLRCKLEALDSEALKTN